MNLNGIAYLLRRCEQLLDDNRRLDEYNQELARKRNECQDTLTRFNAECGGRTSELVERVRRTVQQEFRERLSAMEAAVARNEDERQAVVRRHRDILGAAGRELRK